MALKERHYLTSPSLIAKYPTPWTTIYATRDRSSFITSVSLDPETFVLLLVSFAKHYQLREWGVLISRVEPLVRAVGGFLDGKNYPVKAPTAVDLQNTYYNGWLHSTFVTGMLLFGADGTIV
ncbi:hypothetical protein H257_02027 [Aphanomyces astaci]|uniref:Uncharacterized protein n=1 Tax=Aphanomyces astaci TaxID=112090 RepID=W4H610_APHAT|nr:hypothetical protein H257_02027 [Aphanomyces astaci]ETV87016.1 hypothetical protein H257_02027 [Aphanomyces astaci]|eukprot:XP_009823815.1 hypothetical protein H257_02027 [Aphanomyces astaci]